MSRMKSAVVMLWSVAHAFAQAPPAFLVEPVDGAAAVAVAVLWPHARGGAVPRSLDVGTATIVAQCRLDHARVRVPQATASLHVDADVACVVGVLPAAAADAMPAFVAALFTAGATIDDDTIALATAAVALRADDRQMLLPAGRLGALALAAFALPANGGAPPAAMLGRAPTEFRELLRQPWPVRGALRGAVTPELADALRRHPWGEVASAPPRPAAAPQVPPAGRREEVHARVDQPFVMVAFPAPTPELLPAFVVASEVARARAARRFKLRGSELRAGTPFVAWSALAGDPCVCLHRRGEPWRQLLPGEVAADADAERDATVAELAAFLQDLQQNATTEPEVSRARTVAIAEAGLEPVTAAGTEPAVLGARLRAALLARHRGLDAATLAAVGVDDVQRALAMTLRPEAASWHVLMPAPRADRGWRRR